MTTPEDTSRRHLMRFGGAGALLASTALAAGSASAQSSTGGSGYVNVRDYGALGNGTGNDRAAIEAAISAISPNEGRESERNLRGGIVYLPAGVYRVDRLRLRRNVILMGDGLGTILQQIDSVNAPVIAPASEREYPIGVRDLRIRGARSPSGSGNEAHGILLNTKPVYGGFTVPDGQHIVDSVWIERTVSDGIYIANNCRGTLITDSWIHQCKRGSGIVVDGSDTSIANTISRSHQRGAGFVISSGNARMVNCKAFFCRGGGFEVAGPRANLSTCEAQDNWTDGFRINASDVMMTGCLADSNEKAGFHIATSARQVGGLCMNGFVSIGKNEQQAGKPWVGQSIGVLLSANGTLNDALLSGIARRNSSAQMRLDGRVSETSRIDSVVQG